MSKPPRRSTPITRSPRVNPGGHSSRPRPDNAIYELTTALNKLAAHSFPFELNEVTRTYFENLAKQETGQTAQDISAILATPPDLTAAARLSAEPDFNSNFRTTCVATMLKRRPRPQRARRKPPRPT